MRWLAFVAGGFFLLFFFPGILGARDSAFCIELIDPYSSCHCSSWEWKGQTAKKQLNNLLRYWQVTSAYLLELALNTNFCLDFHRDIWTMNATQLKWRQIHNPSFPGCFISRLPGDKRAWERGWRCERARSECGVVCFGSHLFRMQVYHLFGWFWVMNFIVALGQCTMAGAFASYYWAPDKNTVSTNTN